MEALQNTNATNSLIENPFVSLHDSIVFSSFDWSEDKYHAWAYGIIVGWDDEALSVLSHRFHWDQHNTERLKRLREKWLSIQASMG